MKNYIFIAICVLQVLDILTTIYGIRSGKGVESNGVLAPFFEAVGLVAGLLIVKLLFVGMLIWALPTMPMWALWAMCAGYSWVIWNNVKVIRA